MTIFLCGAMVRTNQLGQTMKHGHNTNLESVFGHGTCVETLFWQATNVGTVQAEALVANALQEQEPKAK